MAPGVTQVVSGGRPSPLLSLLPGSSARSLARGRVRGRVRGRDYELWQASWLSGGHRGPGSGMTHREGSVDAEGCSSMNHHVTLQPGTEVKFRGS